MKKKVFCFFCTTVLVTLLFSSVVWAGGQIECTELEYPDQVIKGQDFVLTVGGLKLAPDNEEYDITRNAYIMTYCIDRKMKATESGSDYFKYGPFEYGDFPIKFRANTADMKVGSHELLFCFDGVPDADIFSDWDQIYFEVVEAPATPEQNPNTGVNTVWFSAAGLLFACSALGIFHIRKIRKLKVQ